VSCPSHATLLQRHDKVLEEFSERRFVTYASSTSYSGCLTDVPLCGQFKRQPVELAQVMDAFIGWCNSLPLALELLGQVSKRLTQLSACHAVVLRLPGFAD
jgi:hypothetical protein